MMTRVGPMDRFDICHAYYCWLADNHSGQYSCEYARLSRLSRYFTPGAVGPMSPEARQLYKALTPAAVVSIWQDSGSAFPDE